MFDYQFISSDVIRILCDSYVKYSPLEFQRSEGREFQGIMKYLTDKTGQNIHDNGTIEITSNSILNDDEKTYHPKHLVDYGINNYYHSKNDKNFYICFDFKNFSVQLTGYSIKSSGYPKDDERHLKSWIIEVSNNNTDDSWTIVDTKENDQNLNEPNVAAFFTNEVQKNEFFRFVRLRQTGPHEYIFFPLIEFFGKLRSNAF